MNIIWSICSLIIAILVAQGFSRELPNGQSTNNAEPFYDWIDWPWIPEVPQRNTRCPTNSRERVFIPSDICGHYYECNSGQPQLHRCPFEMPHWNRHFNQCDNQRTDHCYNNQWRRPQCQRRFTGFIAHPYNCNWFIQCHAERDMVIHQCPTGRSFDARTGSCRTDVVCR